MSRKLKPFMIDQHKQSVIDAHTYGAFNLAYGIGNAGNATPHIFEVSYAHPPSQLDQLLAVR